MTIEDKVGELFTINSRKFDGSVSRTWQCRLIRSEKSLIALEGVFEQDVGHADLGLIAAGTRSFEYFWLDRWYSIFEFFEPSGLFRNAYFNIGMPPLISGNTLDFVDLDLDVVVWPDGSHMILDEAEFGQNAYVLDYPPDIVAKAELALAQVLDIVGANHFPLFTKKN